MQNNAKYEAQEVGILFSARLSELAGTLVVLPRKFHAHLVRYV